MLGEVITASYHTLSGSPARQVSRFTFQERIAAAKEAGYGAIGLMLDDYDAILSQGLSPEAVKATADDHGIVVSELEMIYDWCTGGGESETERRAYAATDVLGSHHVNVGVPIELTKIAPAQLVDAFAELCTRAELHGLQVALEFMPISGLKTMAGAIEVVAGAGRPNGGILLDSWHFFRTGQQVADLANVPDGMINVLQISDARSAPRGTLEQDCRRYRLLPGSGDFDLRGLLGWCIATTTQITPAVEILSTEFQQLSVAEQASASFLATASLIDDVRRSVSQPSA
jgi:sugar phosphate isomerase/epimerase